MLSLLSVYTSGLLESPMRPAVRPVRITMAETPAVASWYDAGVRLTSDAEPAAVAATETGWPPKDAWPRESQEHYYKRTGNTPPVATAAPAKDPAAEEGKVVPTVGKLKKANVEKKKNIDLNEQQMAFEARMRAKQAASK